MKTCTECLVSLSEEEFRPGRHQCYKCLKARNWHSSERGKVTRSVYFKLPEVLEKQRIRKKVQRAVKSGRLARPDKCSKCQTECVPHGHHEDYDRPLDVVWLCEPCHAAVHTLDRDPQAVLELAHGQDLASRGSKQHADAHSARAESD